MEANKKYFLFKPFIQTMRLINYRTYQAISNYYIVLTWLKPDYYKPLLNRLFFLLLPRYNSQLFSAGAKDRVLRKKNMKGTPSKLIYLYSKIEIFVITLAVKFMFSNVAYKPTV